MMEKSMNPMTTAIPQFDGTEIDRWKIRMISHFRRMKWMDLLQPRGTTKDVEVILDTAEKTVTRSQTKTAAEIAADFEDRNNEMMDFIISKVNDSHLYLIATKNTAKEMWEAILQTFQRASRENAAEIRSQLFNMRFDSKTSITNYLKEFTRKYELLRNLGDQMKKEDFMLQCLNSLPKDYVPVKVIMQDRDLNSMSWEKFVSFITSYGKEMRPENHQENSDLPRSVSSFHTQSQTNRRMQCHNCKKPGHAAKNC